MKGQARYKRANKEDRTYRGTVYDSKKEAQYAMGLYTLLVAGKISDLREQVPFVICPKQNKGERDMVYRADFQYVEDGVTHTVDVKGHQTQLYKLKKRLLQYLHGIKIEEV